MPYATLRFSCHPGMFLSSRGRFLYRHRLFFIPPPGLQAHLSCISQGYASAGLYPARFSSALTHSAPRLHDGIPSPPSTQHAFERVTIQELLHHLHIAHFRHRPRFIHPRRFIHLRQLLSTHLVGKEPEVPRHLKKHLRNVLFQPRDQLPLRQRFRRRLSCIVVQVTEAQASPSVVMRQPGGCYRQLLQITPRIARRIPPVGRFLRHVNMPVFPAGLSASDLSTVIPS